MREFMKFDDLDYNLKNNNHMNAFLCAAVSGELEAVKLLLDNPNVDIESRNLNGDNALIWACSEGHSSITQLFLENKTYDINACNVNGNTPFLLALQPDGGVKFSREVNSTVLFVCFCCGTVPVFCYTDT